MGVKYETFAIAAINIFSSLNHRLCNSALTWTLKKLFFSQTQYLELHGCQSEGERYVDDDERTRSQPEPNSVDSAINTI